MNNLDIAKQAAYKAGERVMELYNGQIDIQIKNDDSPVTVADTQANEIIIDILTQTGISVLSEESFDNLDRLSEKKLWIIDPIDGTKDFINKTGEFSIMIGLVENGEPILGVVFVPANNKMYYAEKGKGSFLDIDGTVTTLNCSEKTQDLTILMSRNHTSKEEQLLIDELNITQLKCGSIGVKLGLIAEQKGELYLNLSDKTKEWDTCAPEIILSEAGGTITDVYGEPLKYNEEDVRRNNGILTSNGTIHTVIQEKIKQYQS